MRVFSPGRLLAVRVPGSTSNLGPGFDVLGLAVDRALEARWHPGDAPLQIERRGCLAGLRLAPDDDLLVRALRRGAELATGTTLDGAAPGGRIEVHSTIPAARGLGSSAAARVAGLMLGSAAAGAHLSREVLLKEGIRSEGHPDNVAPAVLGGLVAAGLDADGPEASGVRSAPVPLSPRVGWCYAAPGAVVRTDEARAVLPATVPHARVGATVARAVILLHGLATADPAAVAWGLRDRVHSPWRLGLVPGGEEAVSAALAAGAWGATLSGSGSGLIALGPIGGMAGVCEAMAGAFAGHGDARDAHAFVFRPDPRGARWLGGVP